MESKGKILVLDGLDGSGKSTQVQLVAKYIESKGYSVLIAKEPTNGAIGTLIKKLLHSDDKVSPIMLQLLFAADRMEHIEKEIIPALNKGKIVICDRYIYSSMAYAIGADLLWVHDINKNFLPADLTIYLKVPPVICFQRISNKKKDSFESSPEIMETAYKNYERIAKTFPNISVIDGNRAIDEVFHSVESVLKEKLGI